MQTFEETMRRGAFEYAATLAALEDIGVNARFTQTGGMNAAIVAYLDGGAYMLVTDAEDALSWERADKDGWAVSVYASDEDRDLLAEASTDDTTDAALVLLVRQVLRAAAGRG
jgi:hypothetical protein